MIFEDDFWEEHKNLSRSDRKKILRRLLTKLEKDAFEVMTGLKDEKVYKTTFSKFVNISLEGVEDSNVGLAACMGAAMLIYMDYIKADANIIGTSYSIVDHIAKIMLLETLFNEDMPDGDNDNWSPYDEE